MDDVVPGKRPRVDKQELEMAETLIERFTTSFDHAKYEDEYRAKLLAVVKRKQKGEEVHAPPKEKAAEPTDLMDALRASVEAAKRSGNGSAKKSRKRTTRRRTRAKSKR
jgi:DNA end-binding protein Ku